MSVALKMTLGTVNFTDWIHVTASKISAPSTIVYETWIDVPVSSLNFVIPNLDPTNYYIRYYDSPTNSALGTLKLEMLVNAVTGETISERRYYKCGGPNEGDPEEGGTHIIDTYLINKTITGCFKEAFRYYVPETEWEFDETTGDIHILTGVQFSADEIFSVEIKYTVSDADVPTGSNGGLYSGILTLLNATETLLSSDINKRVVFMGSGTTQVVTLCTLSSIAEDQGFYFDNSFAGVAMQVKIIFPGSDRLYYNGFMAASDLFAEFWVSKGEHLLIRKYNDSFWNVIADYEGVRVGERMSSGFKSQPAWIPENGTLYDGDEYGRLWWFINNQLPVTHVITDDNVTSISYVHPTARTGQFVKHSTLKKFRVPNTQNLSERGLANFTTYGTDTANRPYDYPGGYQAEMVGPHTHAFDTGDSAGQSDNANDRAVMLPGSQTRTTSANTGTEQRVKGIGVIYMRHI